MKRWLKVTLFALLGLVVGLAVTGIRMVKEFGSVAGESADPSQKARVLAQTISEAMNFGAFVTICLIVVGIGVGLWLPPRPPPPPDGGA